MKKCLPLFMLMLFCFLFNNATEASAQQFKDIPPSHPFYAEITELNEQGIISGFEDGTFRPDTPLTRGQTAKILVRALNLSTNNVVDAKLKDIPKTHPYYKEISALKEMNILSGFEDGTFRPNAHLQRHHIAKMLTTAFLLNPFREQFPFNDVPENYQFYVHALYDNDVTKGKTATTFDGRAIITRGQMAALLYRAMEEASNVRAVKSHDNLYSNAPPLFDVTWKAPHYDAIFATNNETLSLVEVNDQIDITTFNKDYKQIATKSIPLELPLFGAFYHGERYNYIAFGQTNKDEKNIEVIRIVKYDHNFNKLGSASIYGDAITTTVPFDASSGGQMAELGNKLVYHTSREHYKSEDGLNHQSQLTIELNTDTMTVTNELEEFQWNHVSHSFDQYVLFDGAEPVFFDHGDAYPRSIVLHKENADSSNETEVDVHKILGQVGMNYTGVTMGGVTQSDTHYLVAFNAMPYVQYVSPTSDHPNRDITIVSVDKQTLETDMSYINYAEHQDIYNTPPKIIKIKDDKFLVLWQDYFLEDSFGYVNGAYVDGKGDFISEIYIYPNAQLSNAQPVLFNDQVVWNLSLPDRSIIYGVQSE